MADRFVDPSVGSSGAGTSWATAYKTLKEATDAAAASETIYFSNGTADVITINTTYTLAEGVNVISCAGATNAYATGATISSTTFGVDIVFRGKGALYGISVAAANSGTSTLTIGDVDNTSIYAEDCIFSVPSNSASQITIGATGLAANAMLVSKRCKFNFGATGSSIVVASKWLSNGDLFADSGSIPTTLITEVRQNQNDIIMTGCDLSALTGTILVGNAPVPVTLRLNSCKLNASATLLGTTVSGGSSEVFASDCSFDNAGTLTGLLFYHENHYGSTTVSTSIYADTADTVDGTTKVSWLIDGKANSAFGRHYQSPWVAAYNADISTAITPRLECVRSGSATAYTNEELWAEFAYRGAANSPALTFVTDRRSPVGSAANQDTSALGASDWAGESGTSWFGELEATASFTPAEVGYLMARVCVGGDHTVYVNPRILGLA